MSEERWVKLSAKLRAAETSSDVFEQLCLQINVFIVESDETEANTEDEVKFDKLGGDMTNILNPWALNVHGIPIHANIAPRYEDYKCPACATQLVLRRGDERVPHFAHKPESACLGEGINHKVAKEMVRFMCYRHLGGSVLVRIIRKCSNCCSSRLPIPLLEPRVPFEHRYYKKTPSGALVPYLEPESPFYTDVQTEVKICGFRVDVVLFREENPVLGIEVQDHHPVSREKWSALEREEFMCMEVSAQAVLQSWNNNLVGVRPINLDLKCMEYTNILEKHFPRTPCFECDLGGERGGRIRINIDDPKHAEYARTLKKMLIWKKNREKGLTFF